MSQTSIKRCRPTEQANFNDSRRICPAYPLPRSQGRTPYPIWPLYCRRYSFKVCRMFTVSISRWFESRTAKRWKPPVWGRPPQRQRCVLRAQAIPDKEAGRAEHHHAVRFPHVPDVPACSPVLLTSHSGMKDTRSSCSLRLRKGQTEISMDTAGTSAAAISAPTGTSAATGADATGAATGATAGDDPPTAPAIPSSMAS